MTKIFDLLGGVIIKWKNREEVREVFRKIIASKPGKLFKQFFERMLIMNNQHFKYLVQDHGPRKKADERVITEKKPEQPKKKKEGKKDKKGSDNTNELTIDKQITEKASGKDITEEKTKDLSIIAHEQLKKTQAKREVD